MTQTQQSLRKTGWWILGFCLLLPVIRNFINWLLVVANLDTLKCADFEITIEGHEIGIIIATWAIGLLLIAYKPLIELVRAVRGK